MATKNATRTPAAGDGAGKITARQAQALFRKATRGKATVTRQYVDDVEEMFGGQVFGVARRLGLALAACDGAWFKKLSTDREMAVIVAGQFEAIDEAAATLKGIAAVLEAASWRAAVALCKHKDMQEILNEAKAHAVVTPPSGAPG